MVTETYAHEVKRTYTENPVGLGNMNSIRYKAKDLKLHYYKE